MENKANSYQKQLSVVPMCYGKENKIVTKKIIVIKSQTIKKEYKLGLKLINRSMENWVNPNSTSIF